MESYTPKELVRAPARLGAECQSSKNRMTVTGATAFSNGSPEFPTGSSAIGQTDSNFEPSSICRCDCA
jgi:hypothetical protein